MGNEVSPTERALTLALFVVLPGAVALVIAGATEDLGGDARWIGLAGIAAFVVYAARLGARRYRAAVTAALPTSVGRVGTRPGPARSIGALRLAVAVVLPIGASIALLALHEGAWLPVAAVLALGCGGAVVASSYGEKSE